MKKALILSCLLSLSFSTFSLAQDNSSEQTTADTTATEQPEKSPEKSSESYVMKNLNPSAISTSKYIFEAKPGSELTFETVIANTSTKDWNFEFYNTDTTLTVDGKLTAARKDAPKNALATWITINPSTISLKSDEQSIIQSNLKIPADAPAKNYFATLIMEREAVMSNTQGISINTRIANFIELTVTDHPYTIPAAAKQPFQKSLVQSFFQKYYFPLSLGLFGISILLLIWSGFKDRRKA